MSPSQAVETSTPESPNSEEIEIEARWQEALRHGGEYAANFSDGTIMYHESLTALLDAVLKLEVEHGEVTIRFILPTDTLLLG